jgi:4-hydroxyphenylpyruvate dioxygenase
MAFALGELVGGGMTRINPRSDRFEVHDFDHIEYWCCDASSAWRRFALGLGLQLVAKSDQSTGNATYASYVCRRVPARDCAGTAER